MHRSTGRVFRYCNVCLPCAGLFAPAVLAQGEEDSPDTCGSRSRSRTTGSSGPVVFIGGSRSAAAPSPPPPVSKPATRTGPPAEAGLPGWMWAPPAPHVSSGLGLARKPRTRWAAMSSTRGREPMFRIRLRFARPLCPRPAAHQNLGNDYFLRVTGKWWLGFAKSMTSTKSTPMTCTSRSANRDSGTSWQGRFLTWRVFRKGLGFRPVHPRGYRGALRHGLHQRSSLLTGPHVIG